MSITQKRLKELATYDPTTGKWSGKVTVYQYEKPGEYNYRKVLVDGKTYRSGRLAWLYMTGAWPNPEIDHKDRDGLNDRWENLREATRSQNTANRAKWGKSGMPKGVARYGNRYRAACGHNGKEVYLGMFATIEEASAAYQDKVKKLHGSFASI